MAKPKKTPPRKAVASKPASKSAADECFTIMPFGGWFDDYYSTIYCPAIERAGLIPRRADDLYRPSAIVHDIWTYTKRSKLVLADLTGKNPNVFYELGLAHAIAKPAILIAESIADVPFDLRALRVLEYDKNDPGWGEVLRTKIESAIREVLDSPLQSVLPSFLDVEQLSRTPVSVHQKELLEIRSELDLLRNELRRRTVHSDIRIGFRPDEARALIASYVRRGLPQGAIVERLERRGVPIGFIVSRIEEEEKARRGSANLQFMENHELVTSLSESLDASTQTKPEPKPG